MKTFNLYVIIVLMNLFALKATAQHKKHGPKTVHVSTCVLVDNLAIKNYSITLYKDGVKLDSLFNDDLGAIDVILPLNKTFTIEIKKEGFESKLIIIDTNLPQELDRLTKKAQMICVNITQKNDNHPYAVGGETATLLVIDKEGILVNKSKQLCLLQNKQISGCVYLPFNSH